MAQLVALTLGLALFRRQPQDFPFSPPLTRGLGALAIVFSTLLMAQLIAWPLAIAAGIGGVLAMVFFTQNLLRLRKHEARLHQTLAAHFAVGSLFTLAMLPAMLSVGPYLREVMNNPQLLEQVRAGQAQMPGSTSAAALLLDVLVIWNLVVAVRINRAAAELSTPASWLTTLGSLFVVMAFVTLSQLVALPFVAATAPADAPVTAPPARVDPAS